MTGAASSVILRRHMRKWHCFLAVLILINSVAFAESNRLWATPSTMPTIEDGHEISYELKPDAPKTVKAWWATQAALRAEAKPTIGDYKKMLMKDLASARRGRITGTNKEDSDDNLVSIYTYATAEDKKDKVTELEEKVAEQTVLIASVDRVLFYSETPPAVGKIVGNPIIKVHQIINGTTCLATLCSTDVYLVGLDTTNMTDETEVELKHCAGWICDGT